jgi:hypothetical protein
MLNFEAYVLDRRSTADPADGAEACRLAEENTLFQQLARMDYPALAREEQLHSVCCAKPVVQPRRWLMGVAAAVLAGLAACGAVAVSDSSARLVALFHRLGFKSPEQFRAEVAAGPAPSSVPVSLALEEPNNSLMMAMVHRGAVDYFVVHNAPAKDIAELETGGFLPYGLPDKAQLDYKIVEGRKGPKIQVTCGAPYVYSIGQHDGLKLVGQGLPVKGPFTEVTVPGVGSVRANNFACAEYLNQGYTMKTLAPVLQRHRIIARLLVAADEYNVVHRQPPASLDQLEEFIGTARSPEAWKGVVAVERLAAVEDRPGNLFVGWTGARQFQLRINLGPEVVGATMEPYGGIYILVDCNLGSFF